jgi:helicase
LGEVVLLAPSWDGQAEHYPKGKFEQIRSGLARSSALAEQIIAEVASDLCKSHAQLDNIFSQSLASRQGKLPSVNRVVDEMLEAGMLALRETEGDLRLRITRLGFVAVRHLLSPETVLLFRRVLESYDQLTFLDLLLIAASSEDCEPILPVDFEQLDPLSDELSHEPTLLLELSRYKLRDLLGIDGKRLLAAIHTAMTARDWTRLGDAAQVADKRGCYAFEVHRLTESVQRSLQAMSAVLSAIEAEEKPLDDPELVPLRERIQVLGRMVSGGLDERTATLTVIPGIGAKLAKRLKQLGIADIEDLALTDAEQLADNPRISINRAKAWIERAAEIVDSRWSAYRYREESTQHQLKGADWSTDIDPYRLRRATSLRVEFCAENTYRVTGGLDPHTVTVRGSNLNCDCVDRAKENICKHILAVRLKRKDSTLHKLSQVLNGMAESTELNLLELWMENHR